MFLLLHFILRKDRTRLSLWLMTDWVRRTRCSSHPWKWAALSLFNPEAARKGGKRIKCWVDHQAIARDVVGGVALHIRVYFSQLSVNGSFCPQFYGNNFVSTSLVAQKLCNERVVPFKSM